jgi:Tol biopolymer transport system component
VGRTTGSPSGTSKRRLGLIGAGLVLAIGSGADRAAGGGAGGAKTTRVSVSSHEAKANGWSLRPAISHNGRFVAFGSEASNLIRHDTNGDYDIFIRDRKRGTTRRVSVGPVGRQANGHSTTPATSATGRFVAFESRASNLVAGDTNGKLDIFVRDLRTGRTRRVSVSSGGAQGDGDSGLAVISGDARFVAFYSRAVNLVGGDTNQQRDVFVHDRRTGETERVNVSSSGVQANGDSGYGVALSTDGRFVAFASEATNLVSGDTNRASDVFVHDRNTGETTRVSVSSAGNQGNKRSREASISADGRLITFTSHATNLVPGDTNACRDVFVHDRATGETTRVSLTTTGAEGDNLSQSGAISANGRFVAFHSRAFNLVGEDTNQYIDAFVHDRRTGETRLVGVSSGGGQANGSTNLSAISAHGRFVAFESRATNLVRGDTKPGWDIFVRGPLRWGSR